MFNANNEKLHEIRLRNGRYFAQLNAADGKQHRYRLEQAQTLPQAVLARQALKQQQQSGGGLPPPEFPLPTKEGPKEGRNLTEVIKLFPNCWRNGS